MALDEIVKPLTSLSPCRRAALAAAVSTVEFGLNRLCDETSKIVDRRVDRDMFALGNGADDIGAADDADDRRAVHHR